ncbi:ABC transporter permease [Clostridium sporogenes]|uniref:ABC transporter permease n=1 Tax=Clostridium sporogenes TaxID=1509 RepID=UPI0005EEDA57|nr:ABC transporter permease [Clostridium sporogenes]NFF79154.1 ABC transporter permease [Clostridium sporogenes]NFL79649.1 ABC transporter permease [Clostridium sporogenes]NFU39255.1 ABC transporter permease [Clostridium sporogenes]NFU79162.1 ABC transporter permease [Clostridium sporogenes]
MKKKGIYFLLLPGIVLIVFSLILPLFSTITKTFDSGSGFSLSRYVAFFKDPYLMSVYYRTLKLSLISTIISVVLGFPTSYYISKSKKNIKGLFIIFAVFPLLTSAVVRSFSWMVILGKKGVINNFLINIGLIDTPLELLYNEISIVVGFVYLFLPLMIMSLIGVMDNIDSNLIEAAESLGASRFQAFVKVVFPLSVPGIIVGSILVFTGSFTAYTTPQLLGGNKSRVLATLIYQKAMALSDWNSASVIATIMIITTIVISLVINNLAAKLQGRGEV